MPHISFKIKAESISTFGTNGLTIVLECAKAHGPRRQRAPFFYKKLKVFQKIFSKLFP